LVEGATMKCTNSNLGTFNHECGKPACWIGTHSNGHRQLFCDRCHEQGDEARFITQWTKYTHERFAGLIAEDRKEAARAVFWDY